MTRVAVVGCGPAGLAAAHAAHGHGASVTIFSPGEPSPQAGPLLLQRPIPGITTSHPHGYIKQLVIGGSILDYRYKLYGDINININGNILQPGYAAWDHFAAYRAMWDLYMREDGDRVRRVTCQFSGPGLAEISRSGEWDLIVSTAPLNRLCFNWDHEFTSAAVVVTPRAEYPDQPDDTIIFNAGDEYPWVRSSRIFGNEVTEWLPGTQLTSHAIALPGSRTVRKPISTDCNCFPMVLLTGRFGSWRNETWVPDAYYDTLTALVSIDRNHEWESVR